MADSPAEQVHRRFTELSKPSASLLPASRSEVSVACEAARRTLRSAAQELVDDAAGLPILTSKSCDGTPMRVAWQASRALPSGKKLRTAGRCGVEFLVSNQFLKAQLPGDGWTTRVMLAEPIALKHWKSAPAIMAAAQRDWLSLRQMRHTGLAIEHYVTDRAGHAALVRLARRWHVDQPLPAVLTEGQTAEKTRWM